MMRIYKNISMRCAVYKLAMSMGSAVVSLRWLEVSESAGV